MPLMQLETTFLNPIIYDLLRVVVISLSAVMVGYLLGIVVNHRLLGSQIRAGTRPNMRKYEIVLPWWSMISFGLFVMSTGWMFFIRLGEQHFRPVPLIMALAGVVVGVSSFLSAPAEGRAPQEEDEDEDEDGEGSEE